jgi:D-glycero-D-manno-heptose 1,7-bisphosphate phosphatase
MTKLLIVDCDGTLREPKNDSKHINSPEDQKIILGADKAVSYYHNQGYIIIAITNQGGVEKGYKTLKETVEEQVYTLKLFPEISHLYFCPDIRGNQLVKVGLRNGDFYFEEYKRSDFLYLNIPGELKYKSFRKPGNGMLMVAIDSLETYPERILYIGDRPEDKQAAISAEIDFLWADKWREMAPPTPSERSFGNRL